MPTNGEIPKRSNILNRYTDRSFTSDRITRGYQRQVLDPFIVAIGGNGQVLDIASGKGEVGSYLSNAGLRVVNVDLSALALQAGRGNRVRSLADQLPFGKASFDGIHMKDALIHMEDTDILFGEISRVLDPNGTALITSLSSNEGPLMRYDYLSGFDEERKEKSFSTMDEYFDLVGRLSRDPYARWISPPFFPTTPEKTIAAAKKADLVPVGDVRSWKMGGLALNDWYDQGTERFVIQFEKAR